VFVVIALFFVYQPQQTIGQAANWTNTLSLAFLSGANSGSLDQPDQAKHQVADHLFETLIYRPWVVLEFGGLSHCVDGNQLDSDGFPKPVGPHDPTRTKCRDHITVSADGHGGYAPRFLRQDPGSDARNAEYEALKNGKAPTDSQFAGDKVDKADAPAVDIQQAGGAFQRLTFSALVFLGALGAVVLLGALSLAVILAQIVALVLLGFAPIALVVGIFPGAGHAFFRSWLAKLATAVFIKAIYSLIIALVVAVSAALAGATGSLGFLFAFGLQTLFFWALFIYRKQITGRLVAATTGSVEHPLTPRMAVMQRGAHAAARPVTALVSVARPGSRAHSAQQASALAGGGTTGSRDESAASSSGVEPVPATSSGPARPEPQVALASNTSSGGEPPRPQPVMANVGPGGLRNSDAVAAPMTPRSAHEDAMQRARELPHRTPDPVTAGGQERRG
jgi:TrbL/VirB6 plasmid conjugal transfer protein